MWRKEWEIGKHLPLRNCHLKISILDDELDRDYKIYNKQAGR